MRSSRSPRSAHGSSDCAAVTLYTNEAMVENLQLYPRLGYVETGRGVEEGYRRVYFEKRLDAGVSPR